MRSKVNLVVVAAVACCGVMLSVPMAGGCRAETDAAGEGYLKYFSYAPLDFRKNAPGYDLPLEAGRLNGFDDAASRLMLAPGARENLLANGFVVTEFPFDRAAEHFDEAYMVLDQRDVPIFVTSSSLLHGYHIIFDYTLQTVETQHIYDSVWRLAGALFKRAWQVYGESQGDLKEAARRDAVYLAVGLSLMKPDPEGDYLKVGRQPRREVDETGRERIVEEIELPDGSAGANLGREFTSMDLGRYTFDVPDEIQADVGKELALIRAHAGFAPSPLFKYEEDYSQYVPRGHYTVSQKLEHYFLAMMWFGRMSMLLKGSEEIAPGATCSTCDALVSKYDARVQTAGACLLAGFMADDSSLMAEWDAVYRVTSFFVGFSDDLGPYEYIEAMRQTLGGTGLSGGMDEAAYDALRARLAEYRSPRIYGGTGKCTLSPPFTPAQADECLASTRGFRLMGQRYVPDSYIFSNLVTPYVGEFRGRKMPFTGYEIPGLGIRRVFPRGLDLFAVIGSDRALDLLNDLGDDNYEGFEGAFRKMYDEIDAIDDTQWHRNLYWNWLWVLKSLAGQYGRGYPAFMQTKAWQDRLLTMALASWTELRHDTVLYAKQSYTMALTAAPPPSPPLTRPRGFVEPVPEVYNRLLSLTRMTRLGLVDMGMLQENEMLTQNMLRLERTLERLIGISVKQLAGEKLDRADMDFIGDFHKTMRSILEGVDRDSNRTTVVADVHTDTNSGLVLEEGCGYVELMVVAYKYDNAVWLAAGPEISYYEFKQPMAIRLTDEEWRSMLELNKPAPPPWTASYRR